jgi:Flp pilus assembly protein TadD
VLKLKPAPSDEAVARNALAWVLVTGPEELRDPAEALPLAERAVELARNSPELARNLSDYVNTQGVVYYRLGEYKQARDTLKRAADLHKQEPAAENRFFLAMVHHRLGEVEKARECYDQAVAWLKAQPALTGQRREELAAFRAEAEALLMTK